VIKGLAKTEGVKVIGYYINNKLEFPFNTEYRAKLNSNTPEAI
jgi:UDP-N-acetylmuramate--alanine ligase